MKVSSTFAVPLLVIGPLVGCVDSGAKDDPVSSGASGSGGLFGSGGEPAPEGGAAAGSTGGEPASAPGGRCSAVPPSAEARLDNFEDGDDFPVAEPERRAAWHIPPASGEEMLSLSVEQGGADESDFAGHITISGFSERASVGVSLRSEQAGVSCPYNVTGTTGIGFYAKGQGTIDLLLDTTDTWSTEFGGSCDDTSEVCWDQHHKLLPLEADWAYHEVPWDAFVQAGWGKLVPFAPANFLGIQFAVGPKSMPADFWIDDLRLLTP
jgi:hypothetical protein